MAGIKLELTGDWNRAQTCFNKLSTQMRPAFVAQILSDGEFVVQKMKDYFDSNSWAPNAPNTIRLKGHSKVGIETGGMRDSIAVREGGGVGDFSILVGPDPSYQQILIWFEGGTTRQPPRPLIEPTFEEVKDVLKSNWKELMQRLVMG
jgi:hypothetical protein